MSNTAALYGLTDCLALALNLNANSTNAARISWVSIPRTRLHIPSLSLHRVSPAAQFAYVID